MNCARALLDPHYQKTNASSFLSNRVSKLPDNPVKRFDTNDVSLAIGFTKLLVRNNNKNNNNRIREGNQYVAIRKEREKERDRTAVTTPSHLLKMAPKLRYAIFFSLSAMNRRKIKKNTLRYAESQESRRMNIMTNRNAFLQGLKSLLLG